MTYIQRKIICIKQQEKTFMFDISSTYKLDNKQTEIMAKVMENFILKGKRKV